MKLVLYLAALLSLATVGWSQTYTHDGVGRLSQVTYAGGTTIVYSYDAGGNLVAEEVLPQPPASAAGSDGCFIATAAYGSALHPHVSTLRRFRDRHLLTSAPGRAFVRLYYAYSPALAQAIEEYPLLGAAVRALLFPVVFVVSLPWTSLLLALVGGAILLRRRRRRALAAMSVPA